MAAQSNHLVSVIKRDEKKLVHRNLRKAAQTQRRQHAADEHDGIAEQLQQNADP